MARLKVMTVLGTRPEIIRLSRVLALLDQFSDHQIVHTGQNWDYELNELFFSDLGVRKPDHFLEVDTSSLGAVLGGILMGAERVLKAERPDALLVLGDTNSAIAAIMARRLKIPIYHMEAGNRSFDPNVPEETNRRMIDHISDFNLVYTEHARRHLLSEGIRHQRIYLTGSPMNEVLAHYRPQIEASDILARLQLTPQRYFVVSIHREENVDSRERLQAIVSTLTRLSEAHDVPVVVSTHPRTRNRLEAIHGLSLPSSIHFMKPFGFHDYNQLQMHALCAISDSGTIAEESAVLGFPAVTPRDAIERPEALDTGDIIVTGLDPNTILDCVAAAIHLHERRRTGFDHAIPVDYRVNNTSERVLKLILGTAKLSNAWDGIRLHDYL